MLRLLFAALVAPWLLFGCDGQPPAPAVASRRHQVVRGTVNDGDPAVAFITIRETVDGVRRIKSVCSGTLVDPFATGDGAASPTANSRFVLTARHCAQTGGQNGGDPIDVADVDVFFATRPNLRGTGMKVDSIALNPDTDLAVLALTLAGPAAPMPLNRNDLKEYVGETLRFTGFGVTSTGAKDAGVKRVGSSVLLAASTAGLVQTATRISLDTNGDVAVVGPGDNGQTICSGDSGGPEFLHVDGVDFVAGVTSFSYGPPIEGQDIPDCTDPETVAGVVRVDRNIEWIQNVAKKHGAEGNGTAMAGQVPNGCSAAASTAGAWFALLLLFLWRRRPVNFEQWLAARVRLRPVKSQ